MKTAVLRPGPKIQSLITTALNSYYMNVPWYKQTTGRHTTHKGFKIVSMDAVGRLIINKLNTQQAAQRPIDCLYILSMISFKTNSSKHSGSHRVATLCNLIHVFLLQSTLASDPPSILPHRQKVLSHFGDQRYWFRGLLLPWATNTTHRRTPVTFREFSNPPRTKSATDSKLKGSWCTCQ